MSESRRVWKMAARIRRERLGSIRLKIMWPILLLFLPQLLLSKDYRYALLLLLLLFFSFSFLRLLLLYFYGPKTVGS